MPHPSFVADVVFITLWLSIMPQELYLMITFWSLMM